MNSISIEIVGMGYSDESARAAHASAMRQLGAKLIEELMKSTLPATVDIVQEEIPSRDVPYGTWGHDILRITAIITPVQHRHITFTHSPDMDYRAIAGRNTPWWKKFLKRGSKR